jgi:hypothetical protein
MSEQRWLSPGEITEPGEYVGSYASGRLQLVGFEIVGGELYSPVTGMPLRQWDQRWRFLGPIKHQNEPERIAPRWGLFEYEQGAIKSYIMIGADTATEAEQAAGVWASKFPGRCYFVAKVWKK